jgi:hypothetical protein
MIQVDIFVSGGSDSVRFRNVAATTLVLLQHMFQNELRSDLFIRNWDYRNDAPRIVPRGQISSRSLAMVERTDILVAIFHRRLPPITCAEVRRIFERRRAGHQVQAKVFVHRTYEGDQDLRAFFKAISDDFAEDIVYQPYGSPIEFQGYLFTALTPLLLQIARGGSPDLARQVF